jgi:hypothetical protein
MRVKDAAYSVHGALGTLAWRPRYLAAMWVLCGELRSLYAEWIDNEAASLMTSTMDLVREVTIAGESPQLAGRATELATAWRRVINARKAEASGALLNFWATFEALAQEIAGLCSRYDAAGWATNAAEDRWRDLDDPALIIVNRNEEVDDSSPMAQTLALFGQVVSEVAGMKGPEWDPERIRAQIFEQR